MKIPWTSGTAYNRYMGRWSALVAREFLAWLAAPPGQTWLDVGCGTGTLTRLILEGYQPQTVIAIDASPAFIDYAQEAVPAPNVHFKVSLAQALNITPDTIDVVVSGLVLNFVPQPEDAIAEMLRVARPGGQIGVFVWDYAQGMQMLRYFWDAAIALDPPAEALDEGPLFPICQAGQLEERLTQAGLQQVQARPIEVITRFTDFDDYWQPFLSQIAPAPSYVASISGAARQRLKDQLQKTLPIQADGSISLMARAWAVKGRNP